MSVDGKVKGNDVTPGFRMSHLASIIFDISSLRLFSLSKKKNFFFPFYLITCEAGGQTKPSKERFASTFPAVGTKIIANVHAFPISICVNTRLIQDQGI